MTSKHRVALFATALVLAALMLTACTSSGEPEPANAPEPSGIEGVSLMLGGGGGFADTETASQGRPYAGDIEIHEGEVSGELVTTCTADESGVFKVDLPSGTYTLVQVSAEGIEIGEPVTVAVRAGEYATVTLTISAL